MYVTAYDPPVSWTTRTPFVGDAILVSFITDDWTTWGRVVNCITSSALARATSDTPTPATAIRRVTFVINWPFFAVGFSHRFDDARLAFTLSISWRALPLDLSCGQSLIPVFGFD